MASSSSSSSLPSPTTMHMSGLGLTSLPEALLAPSASSLSHLLSLDLSCNQLREVAGDLSHLASLEVLNLSDNQLTSLEGLVLPASLRTLLVGGNLLEGLCAKTLAAQCPHLESLTLSGNKLAHAPAHLDLLSSLRSLQLGSNQIEALPEGYLFPASLTVLYLGGNRLASLPQTIGLLPRLKVLSLHENRLSSLPPTMVQLSELEVLNLHRNQLSILPVELLGLRRLRQLSVRQNPLLTQFAGSYHRHLPTLQELAGRALKRHGLSYSHLPLPPSLLRYLDSSSQCLGCGGAYFKEESALGHVEFVDLCGSYRVPFLQYICSTRCKQDVVPARVAPSAKVARLRKILLDKYSPSESRELEQLQREYELMEEEGSDLV